MLYFRKILVQSAKLVYFNAIGWNQMIEQYSLLILLFGSFFILLASLTDPRCYPERFANHSKYDLKPNSITQKIIQKIWLRKKRNARLSYLMVIPLVIHIIMCAIAVVLYALFWIFYFTKFGNALGMFLGSAPVIVFAFIWFLVVCIYLGIIQAL